MAGSVGEFEPFKPTLILAEARLRYLRVAELSQLPLGPPIVGVGNSKSLRVWVDEREVEVAPRRCEIISLAIDVQAAHDPHKVYMLRFYQDGKGVQIPGAQRSDLADAQRACEDLCAAARARIPGCRVEFVSVSHLLMNAVAGIAGRAPEMQVSLARMKRRLDALSEGFFSTAALPVDDRDVLGEAAEARPEADRGLVLSNVEDRGNGTQLTFHLYYRGQSQQRKPVKVCFTSAMKVTLMRVQTQAEMDYLRVALSALLLQKEFFVDTTAAPPPPAPSPEEAFLVGADTLRRLKRLPPGAGAALLLAAQRQRLQETLARSPALAPYAALAE